MKAKSISQLIQEWEEHPTAGILYLKQGRLEFEAFCAPVETDPNTGKKLEMPFVGQVREDGKIVKVVNRKDMMEKFH